MVPSDRIRHIPEIQYGGRPEHRKYFEISVNTRCLCMYATTNEFSTATPKFAATPDLDMALRTLFDIDRHPECKMAAIKPEVEITFERKQMAKRFQRLPHIFDHDQLRNGTANPARYRPTPEMSATKPEVETTVERRQMMKRFQRLPPHFRPCPTRQRLTSGTQNRNS